jgi:archaea-specific DNA-binding protein
MTEKSRIVFIGSKPPMDYVLAIITGLSVSNAKEITLKARGRAITTAVDAAEITRSRFLKDLKVTKIAIGTEEMPAREGENRARMVSTVEITLTKE